MLRMASYVSPRILPVIFALIALGESPGGQTFSCATVQPSQTSLTLPAGNSVYIYGLQLAVSFLRRVSRGGTISNLSTTLDLYSQAIDAAKLEAQKEIALAIRSAATD